MFQRSNIAAAVGLSVAALACSSAQAVPEVTFIPPGPGLNLPYETTRDAVEYGVNWLVAGVNVFDAPDGTREMRPIANSAIARYFTSLQNPPNPNDTANRLGLPTDEDWVLHVKFRNTGNDFNGALFLTRAKESLPGEQNLIVVRNNGGANNWDIEFADTDLMTGLSLTSPIDAPVFHTLDAHYKAQSLSLDLWLDGVLQVPDHDVTGIDMAIDFFQSTTGANFASEGRDVGFAEVYIGQLGSAGLPGDFNDDGQYTTNDIELLCAAIDDGGPDDPYDVNGDNAVTSDDLTFWVQDIKGTNPGDTELDGDVDLSDLGNLASNYEQTPPRTWGQGDFDCDDDVDLSDLGTLATYYGTGQAQAYADFSALTGIQVPEPAGIATIGLAAGTLGLIRRRERIYR